MQDVPIWYRLDGGNLISGFSDNWAEATGTGDGDPAGPDRLAGTSIFSVCADAATRHYYACMFDKVRRTRREIGVTIRCDLPSALREYRLRIRPAQGAELVVEIALARSAPSTSPALRTGRGDARTVMCSWCQAISDGAGGWMPLELAVERQGLLARAEPLEITHGICPSCRAEMDGMC